MMQGDTVQSPGTRGLTPGRRALLLTLLIFLSPVLIGGALYFSGWRPAKPASHGELILPPRPLPIAALGKDISARASGKWLLIIVGDDSCHEACVRQIELSRNIQVSLNRDMRRVVRMVLSDAPSADLRELASRQPDLVVTSFPEGWRTVFTPEMTAGPLHRVLLVDPAGHLMMQYAPDAEAKGIRADLEKLLKHSWIG